MEIKKYTKKDGSTAYMFNVYVGLNAKGKNVYRKRQGFKTKKQAQIALAKLLEDIEENGFNSEKKKLTLNDLFELWFDHHKLNIKESTAYNYDRFYKKHLKPVLGSSILSDIKVSDCQKVVDSWFKSGLKMYPDLRKLGVQIMKYGVAMEYMIDNPLAKTITPRKKDEGSKLQFYTKEELIHFFNCLEDHGNFKQIAFFRLLAFTGARKGEIFALTWGDIDFTNKMLSISKTLTRSTTNTKLVLSAKTKSSIRTISLDNETVRTMQKWRMIQRSDYLGRGFNTSSEDQFIFTTDNNELYGSAAANEWLKYIVEKYKLPKISPHHFRHTHASLLLQSGIPIKEVSERLGHKDTTITDQIYSHVMPEEAKKTADKFAQFVGF